MPFSADVFDEDVSRLLQESAARRVADFGAGAGKYGRIARQVLPNASLLGIEAEPSYVETYGLTQIYDEVICEDLQQFCLRRPDFTTDVAILGDVIEHLPKSAGVDVLHYLVYRCRRCFIVYPSRYVQFSWNGFPLEAHRSVWGEADFALFDHWLSKRGEMNLVLLDGYLQ